MDHLHDKLDKLHERVERRRLDGVKPTKRQINHAIQCRKLGAYNHSMRVLRKITELMLPEKIK